MARLVVDLAEAVAGAHEVQHHRDVAPLLGGDLRTRRRVSRCCSWVPWERFRRNRSTPGAHEPPQHRLVPAHRPQGRHDLRSSFHGAEYTDPVNPDWEVARRGHPCYHSGPAGEPPGFTREVFPMFDGLQDKLQDVFRQLKGEGKVTPEALDAALRQIRMALLEADVHLRVVKPFIDRVRERALGPGGPREPHPGAAGGQDRARRARARCSARRGPSCASTAGRRSSCSAASRARARRPPPARSPSG